jgi:hypothetical protein
MKTISLVLCLVLMSARPVLGQAEERVLLELRTRDGELLDSGIRLWNFALNVRGEIKAGLQTSEKFYDVKETFMGYPIRQQAIEPRYVCVKLEEGESAKSYSLKQKDDNLNISAEPLIEVAHAAGDVFRDEIVAVVAAAIRSGFYEKPAFANFGELGEHYVYFRFPVYENIFISWNGQRQEKDVVERAFEKPKDFFDIQIIQRGLCDEDAALKTWRQNRISRINARRPKPTIQ